MHRRLESVGSPRQLTIAVALILGAVLLLYGAAGCGGGMVTGGAAALTEQNSAAEQSPGADSREVSDLLPRNLLPQPSSLSRRLDSDPVEICPGSGYEQQLPHRRVASWGDLAVFKPQSLRGRGRGLSNGRFAYALYHLSAPKGTASDEAVDFTLRLDPLFQGGLSGENPLYVALADWNTDSWNVKAQDYNSSRSNTTTARFEPDDDYDGGDGDGWVDLLLAIVVAPSYGGGGGGGVVRLEQLSVSSGWELSVLDDGRRSGFIPSGQQELDAERCDDGSHQLAYFTGFSGLRHARCVDGTCATTRIPGTFGSGPNVSLACDPASLPHVASYDSRRNVGPVRWMAPEGLWRSSSFHNGESSGAPFDPDVCPSIVVDSAGTEHVCYVDPSSGALLHSWRSPGGEWQEEEIFSGRRIRQRPDLLMSEWDDLVCVCRTDGDGGAVYVFQRGATGWEGQVVADLSCPVDADGTSRGYLSADLDRDGRLDIVCNAPDGDYIIHRDLATRRTSVDQLSSSSSSSSCAVVSSGGFAHVFICDPDSNTVQYRRKAAWGKVDRDEVCARIAVGAAGVTEQVTQLDAIIDPDDDGDGISEASCYLMLESSSSSRPSVAHWTLEVRVNRIEMA
ncbi:hypothetical protein JW859_00380 [bacterium]|nr:hypothetical protein [bacterium]